MEKILGKTEAPATGATQAPRKPAQDRQITLRLPSPLLGRIEHAAEAIGQKRSVVIRDMLNAVMAITSTGLTDDKLLQFRKALLLFFKWIDDPIEGFKFMLFSSNLATAGPEIQKEFAILMAKEVVSWVSALTVAEKDVTIATFRDIRLLEEVDQEVLADEFLEAVKRFDHINQQKRHSRMSDMDTEEQEKLLSGLWNAGSQEERDKLWSGIMDEDSEEEAKEEQDQGTLGGKIRRLVTKNKA